MIQDILTKAQAVGSIDDFFLNQGDGFSAVYNTGGLVHTTGSYKVSFTTPAKSTLKRVRLVDIVLGATASPMKFDIHEDTASASGTVKQIFSRSREISPKIAKSVFTVGETCALAGKAITASTAGGNFGNQPNNDGVEIISSKNTDKSMKVTLYGTIHGATTVVVSETLTLNGTTVVSSAKTDWSAILGVEMDSIAAGTVTIRKATGDATITSMATTVLSSGIVAITDSRGRDQKLRIDANGASTKIVGVVGTSPTGSVIGYAAALDGTTEKDLSAYQYRTITKVLMGDVASATEAWVLREEVILDSFMSGSGQYGKMAAPILLEPETKYVFHVSNVGGAATSTGYITIVFNEEDIPGVA